MSERWWVMSGIGRVSWFSHGFFVKRKLGEEAFVSERWVMSAWWVMSGIVRV